MKNSQYPHWLQHALFGHGFPGPHDPVYDLQLLGGGFTGGNEGGSVGLVEGLEVVCFGVGLGVPTLGVIDDVTGAFSS